MTSESESRVVMRWYAIAAIVGFVVTLALVIGAFFAGDTGRSILFLILALVVGFVTFRYFRRISTYTENQVKDD